jgi:hypothetical protein
MTDQNGRAGQLPNSIRDIVNVIGNSGPAQIFPSLTVPVPAQIDGMRGEAVPGKVVEKMRVPTPGSMHHPVDEQERRWMLALDRAFGDDLEFHSSLVRRHCGARRISLSLEPAAPQRGMAL